MRILKLSASFGSLQNAELTLNEGLNVITAPNESGKSTWTAFLMAMLYGVDSSERTTKTNLPVKTKFKPWSGAPMEGRMELEWQGKRITIERSTKGRVPMGEFRAYETASGQTVAGMTGENCGELLLGVSRSVFERSAFIGQGAMALTSDAELEKRLSSLVTAGDETVSFSDTQKTLRDWRNRCRHNRTGLLPQTLMELQETENTLEQIRRLHRSDMELTARREAYLAQQEKLQTLVAALKAREANRALEKKTAAEQALKEAENARRQAEQAASALPARETLQELEKQLALLEAETRRLPEEAEEAPVPPECPGGLPRPSRGGDRRGCAEGCAGGGAPESGKAPQQLSRACAAGACAGLAGGGVPDRRRNATARSPTCAGSVGGGGADLDASAAEKKPGAGRAAGARAGAFAEIRRKDVWRAGAAGGGILRAAAPLCAENEAA